MARVVDLLKEEGLKFFTGISKETLSQIRNLSNGILLITKEESRGVDIRFSKDSRVLIISSVDTYSEYQQMLGRSSRTRDICDGILYSSTTEKASHVLKRLKESEVLPMLDFEALIPLLMNKCDDKTLVKAMTKH